MIDLLSRISDQFDQSVSTADMEKHASFLQERRDGLSSAPFDDFGLVLYDGRAYSRKFPVQTAEDVRMSKEALDKTADHIPAEVVKVARHFIEVAGRQLLGESLYGDAVSLGEGAPLTNVVYAGQIDQRAYEAQLSKTASVVEVEALLPGHDTPLPVPHADAVLQAERGLAKRAFRLSEADQTRACRALVKRANDLGVSLTSDDVTRYGRDVLPLGFSQAVRYRRDQAPEKLASYFNRLAAEADTMGVEKAAECLRTLDKLAGFSSEPGRPMTKIGFTIPTVADVVFPVRETIRPEADLSKVAALFGDEFVDAYRADPDRAKAILTSEERALLAGVQD